MTRRSSDLSCHVGAPSYCRCVPFLQITLTITLITKGGQKGAILNVMPLNQQAPHIYLEKLYIEWHKMGNRRQVPSIPYTKENFLSHNCILLLLNIFSTQLIISAVPWDLDYGSQRLRPQQEEFQVARVCPRAVAQHLEVKCELAELRGRAPLGLRVDSGHFPVPRPPPRPMGHATV